MTVLAVLAGCGQQRQDTTAITAADRSAVSTCARVVAVVERALDTVHRAENGSLGRAGAGRQLTKVADSLRAAADRASDDVVEQSVQDLVDSVTAYLAVLPDRSVGGYEDVQADVMGRLAGFRRTCPIDNADFEESADGWVATSGSSQISRAGTGRAGGGGLKLTNRGDRRSDIGFTDSPNWVDRTWRGTYRAGLWARARGGSPVLTLELRETSGRDVVGKERTSVQLGADWTFVAVSYEATGRGGPLDVRVTVDEAAVNGGVELDDVAVARG